MPEPAQSLLLSTCLGALIGLIRQWEAQQHPANGETEFAGVRTFSIVAMLGCASAHAANTHAPGAFAATLGVLGLLLSVAQWLRPEREATGYTTPGAALLTFFAGALVTWQERQSAVLVAALTALLVGLKQPIHQWTRRFTARDLRSVLQFVAITGVILPIVPNRSFGPFDAFNPWALWLMVVLISGLGFLGYISVRLLGSGAGIALTGFVGGLASSTATTLAFSRRSREDAARSTAYALAISLACSVMLARVLVIAAAIHTPFAWQLLPGLAVMALPGLAFAAWAWKQRHSQGQGAEPTTAPDVANPLGLGTAIQFALLYAVVKFLVRAAAGLDLTEGIVAVSAIAGLTDVDAIAVSLADGNRDGTLAPRLAVDALLVGCIANTLTKAGMAAALGSRALRRIILMVLGATAASGLAGLALFR